MLNYLQRSRNKIKDAGTCEIFTQTVPESLTTNRPEGGEILCMHSHGVLDSCPYRRSSPGPMLTDSANGDWACEKIMMVAGKSSLERRGFLLITLYLKCYSSHELEPWQLFRKRLPLWVQLHFRGNRVFSGLEKGYW